MKSDHMIHVSHCLIQMIILASMMGGLADIWKPEYGLRYMNTMLTRNIKQTRTHARNRARNNSHEITHEIR